MIAFIPGLPGGSEWIIILIIALLIFGKRLPEVMRSMGQSLKQFKKGMEDVETDTPGDTKEEPGDRTMPRPDDEEGHEHGGDEKQQN